MNTLGRMATGLGLAICLAGGALAADRPDSALEGLATCGAVVDLSAKASCYDAASAALASAVKSGELIIVRKSEARAAQRGAFGFNMPSLAIFDRIGGRDDDKDGDKAKGGRTTSGALEHIDGVVKSASADANGHWVIVTDDGAVWRQIDNDVLSPRPRAGSTYEINRAALGSYMMKLDKHRPIRVRRSE